MKETQKGTRSKRSESGQYRPQRAMREEREMMVADRNGCDGSLEWTPRVLWVLLFLIA